MLNACFFSVCCLVLIRSCCSSLNPDLNQCQNDRLNQKITHFQKLWIACLLHLLVSLLWMLRVLPVVVLDALQHL